MLRHILAVLIVIGIAGSTGCMRTTEWRTVPIYDLERVELPRGTASAATEPAFEFRNVQIGTRVEKVTKQRTFSWKKAAILLLMAPLSIATGFAAGLG